MNFGNIIRDIRLSNKMNLREFSKLTDVSFSYLSCIENEKSTPRSKKLKPSIDVLKQICDRTGYSFRQFLEEAEYIEKTEIQEAFDGLDAGHQAKLLETVKDFSKHDENGG